MVLVSCECQFCVGSLQGGCAQCIALWPAQGLVRICAASLLLLSVQSPAGVAGAAPCAHLPLCTKLGVLELWLQGCTEGAGSMQPPQDLCYGVGVLGKRAASALLQESCSASPPVAMSDTHGVSSRVAHSYCLQQIHLPAKENKSSRCCSTGGKA